MKNLNLVMALIAGILANGCRQGSQSSYSVQQGFLTFDAKEIASNQSDTGRIVTWMGTYDAGGKRAIFRIELNLKKAVSDKPFSFGTGTFYHEAGSSPSVLLADLAKVLQAKKPVPSLITTNKLSFATAILGENASRGRGKDSLAGEFTSDPKGDWTVVKVFLQNGDNDGEVYLNLNSKSGQGEFAIKDPDYGDTVLHELARVF